MPPEKKPTVPQKIFRWYQSILDDTRSWREDRYRLEQSYHGYIYTAGEGGYRRVMGETTVVDNRLRPLIRKRVSKLVASKPTGKLFGVSDDDQGSLLDALSAMGDNLWEISEGVFQLEAAVTAMQKLGAGYLVLYRDPTADYGMGEIKFKCVSYGNVYYDKGAEQLNQAPRVIIRRLVDLDHFLEDHPEFRNRKPQLYYPDDTVRFQMEGTDRKTLSTGLPDSFSSEKSFVLLLECYEKVIRNVFIYREFSLDGAVKVSDAGSAMTAEEFAASLDEQQQKAIRDGLAFIIQAGLPRIKVTTVINDRYILSDPEWLELDDYPIIEFKGEDTRNAESRGEVDYLVGNQEFMSKALNLVIGNAAMGSLLRFIADPTKLTDFMTKENLEKAIATPGAILWMMQDSMSGKFPLDAMRPEPLNQAFTFLMQYMSSTMEYSLQQFGTTMGNTADAPRTFAATAQIGEWADESLVLPRNEIERGIQKLYDVFYQWVPHYYTSYKRFSTYDDDMEEEQAVEINAPAGLQENGSIKFLNNISNFRAKFHIRKGSTAPAMSVAKATLFKELLQVTQNPAFLLPMLEHLPTGKYKKQLKESLDVVPQMQQQLQQAAQQIQVMKGELDRQTQQNVELQKRIEVESTSHKVDKEADKAIMELKDLLRQVSTDLEVYKAKQEAKITKTKDSSNAK